MIAHMADIHAGFRSFRRTLDDDTNAREVDFYLAFAYAVKLCSDADMLIIAGDLFDTPHPPNRAIKVVREVLYSFGKDVIVVNGQHDRVPRGDISPLETICIDNVHVFTDVSIFECGGIRFHCVPYRDTPFEFDASADVLVAHIREKRVATKGEHNVIDLSVQPYKLCLLGDYHIRTFLQPNVFYPGSIERTRFDQANEPCGFYMYESLNPHSAKFIEIPTRPMFIVESDDDVDLQRIKDALVKVDVSKVSPDVVQEIKSVAFAVTTVGSVNSTVGDGYVNLSESRKKDLLQLFDEFVSTTRYPSDVIALARDALQREYQRP